MKKLTAILALALALAVVLSGCGGDDDKDKANTTPATSSKRTDTQTTGTSGRKATGGGKSAGGRRKRGAVAGGPRAVRVTWATFVRSVRRTNERRFCSVLTSRYIRELVPHARKGNPRKACRKRYSRFFWAKLQFSLRGVRPGAVTVSGKRARLRLSDGERVRLKARRGRWLIDNIGGRRK